MVNFVESVVSVSEQELLTIVTAITMRTPSNLEVMFSNLDLIF